MGRKGFTVLLTIILVLSLSMTSIAATHDNVDNWDKLETAFQDTDADVIINLTGDIDCGSDILTANQNQVYTINGKDYKLSWISLGGYWKCSY